MFRLEVVDTGMGLSEEEQKKIFGEFIQFNRGELQGGGELLDVFNPGLKSVLIIRSYF